MKRLNIIWYIGLIIILPISIVLLSGNIVLRIPETYNYHFNDSQAADKVGSSITGTEFAKEFSSYFNSPGRDDFQVYEENGEFRDPIFDENESMAMGKAKTIMLWTLFSGVLFFGGGIAIYIYLLNTVERETIRLVGIIATLASALELVIYEVLVSRAGIRKIFYDRFIGIALNKDSTLRLLVGTPFEKTYIIFSSVLCIAIIGILLYIHLSITRERRLFS